MLILRHMPPKHHRHFAATTIIAFAIAASAFAQVKRDPAPRQPVQLEVKVIEAKDGAMGLSVEKGGVNSRELTPQQWQAETQKFTQAKDVDILSAPKLTTNAGQLAIMEIGNGAAKLESGIKISVLPEIESDGILLNVDFKMTRPPKKSEREQKPQTSKLSTFVSVKDGSTILLGGMTAENGRAIVLAVTASKIDPQIAPEAKAKE